MRLAGTVLLSLLAATPAPAAARDLDAALRRHPPVYRLDRAERSGPASVREAARIAPELARLVAAEPPGPHVYARAVRASRARAYLQFWTFHLDNPQDRGLLRTGRHAGDWELVQVRLERGRPVAAVYGQHAWAERCPWRDVEREGQRPVVHVANGSHAAYFERGVHGRPWPDPDDGARDGGPTVRPAVRTIAARHPAWMAHAGRWGAARAGWVPGEQSSPQGPAFHPARWAPAAFERGARPCGAGAPGRPWQIAIEIAAGALGLAAIVAAVTRRRRRRRAA